MSDLKDKTRLLRVKDFVNDASEEETAQAEKRKEDALSLAGMKTSKFAANVCSTIPHQLCTTDIDTMAVTMSGDGAKFMLQNPKFTNSLVSTLDVLFVVLHECLHLLLNHLQRDPELRSDPVWKYACEVVINATCLVRLKRKDMPQATRVNRNGKTVVEPTGVDPRKVYKEYADKCAEIGIKSVSYDKFVESEHSCYSELKRLPDPPGNKPNQQVCIHQGDAADGSGDGSGTQMDQETVDQVVKSAIQQTMTEARQGNNSAREELLSLAALTEDGNEEAKKLWGSYGIGGLRGQTDATRKVEWWKQWLTDVLGSKLEPGSRLIYPKKRAGIFMTLQQDPMLARRGNEVKKVVAVFLDTSGSVPTSVIRFVEKLVGDVPGVVVYFFMFDGVVMKLVPGETVRGGGGTNFQNCIDVVEGRLDVEGETFDENVDAVLMLTDGYAPHVTPAEPDKWIWLITPNGDDWPDSHNPQMDCHFIDSTDVEAAA